METSDFLQLRSNNGLRDFELDWKQIFMEMRSSDYNNALKVFLHYFGDYIEFTKNGEPYDVS